MQIQFPSTLASSAAVKLAVTLPWAVNDVLVAQVVGKSGENFTRLAIGDRIVVARTDAPLATGQELKLKVTSDGPTMTMKVLESSPRAIEPGPVDRGLARVLPQQADSRDTGILLRDLTVLAQDGKAIAATLGSGASAALRQDLVALVRAMPKLDDVTDPPRLRAAVTEASQPTEARVLAALDDGVAPDLSHDLRAQLARIGTDLAALPAHARQSLEQLALHADTPPPAATPGAPPDAPMVDGSAARAGVEATLPDIKHLVDSVVARLEANQLQNTAAIDAAQPLIVDLPVARAGHTDLLHLEVENEAGRNGGEAGARTSVTLHLRLDHGTEFTARLQMSGELLSLRLGSTDAAYNAELERRVGELETGLLAAGLTVNQILLAPLALDARPRLGARQLINETV